MLREGNGDRRRSAPGGWEGVEDKGVTVQLQDATVSVGGQKSVAFVFVLLLFLYKQLQLLMDSRRAA